MSLFKHIYAFKRATTEQTNMIISFGHSWLVTVIHSLNNNKKIGYRTWESVKYILRSLHVQFVCFPSLFVDTYENIELNRVRRVFELYWHNTIFSENDAIKDYWEWLKCYNVNLSIFKKIKDL